MPGPKRNDLQHQGSIRKNNGVSRRLHQEQVQRNRMGSDVTLVGDQGEVEEEGAPPLPRD